MASFCARARRTLQASHVSAARNAISKLCSSNTSAGGQASASKLPGLAASPKQNSAHHCSPQKLFTSSRIPVLGCAGSLMPLHSATASALFTSMLSLHSQSWGCLSEGFATPL